jgi:hypothetical protein
VDKQAAARKTPQDKVAESASTGQGTRLAPRRRPVLTLDQACKEAKAPQAQGSEHAATLGPAGQRAERDVRTQPSMPIRTLVLEHGLRAFRGALAVTRHTTGSFPQVLRLLFARSGSRMETPSQVLYWVKSAGLSLSNRRLLSEVAQGWCAMGLQEKGKPVPVRLKDLPPCGGFCSGPIEGLFLRKLSEVRCRHQRRRERPREPYGDHRRWET